jgi:putative transposase
LALRPKRSRRRRTAGSRRERFGCTAPNQVWGLAFIADQLVDGRRFRALTVVDIYTRESLAIEAGQSMKGEDVGMVLNRILLQRGSPKVLFCDNASEFTSQAMDLWAYRHGVRIDFSRPEKPTDNAFVESFHGTLRAECLDAHWFATLPEAKQLIELWRREYIESRPHRALGEQTPSEFASQFAAQRDLPGLQEPENSP